MRSTTLFSSLVFLLTTSPFLLTNAQIPSFLTTDFIANEGSTQLEVIYPINGDNDVILQDGELLIPDEVANIPPFKLCDSCGIAPDTNYMIMLLDVDAQGEGQGETPQRLHYLTTGFQAGLGGTDLSSTDAPLASYVPPNPTPGTGMHRYVWLLFLQRNGVTPGGIQGVPSGDDRTFDVLAWIRENNLDLPESGVHFVLDSGAGGGEAPPPPPPETTLADVPPVIISTTTTTPPAVTTSESLVASTTTSDKLVAPPVTTDIVIDTTTTTTSDKLVTPPATTDNVIGTATTTTPVKTTTVANIITSTPTLAPSNVYSTGNGTTFTLIPIPCNGTTLFTVTGTGIVGTGTGTGYGVFVTKNATLPTAPSAPAAPLVSEGKGSRLLGNTSVVALLFVASVMFIL